ncbi:mannosyltransferase [Mariniflexile aquimaris]|uniref:Mannosyltransferase n=1 Tax=Mariniflexile aquimaris TaxID=881009 RepID=A0ABW3BMH9_9FLAO
MLLNPTFFKLNKVPLLWALACLFCYFAFAYNLIRTDYIKLIALYSVLFFIFYKLVGLIKNHSSFLIWLAFIFRAVFLFSIPNLSQDFYRFIWDGRMILEGYNPYMFTVESFININKFPVSQAQELYNGMGELNASHFTNYPPLNQFFFALAALFAGKSILGSVVVMRLLIIAADFGTLYFGKKLLGELNISTSNIWWYILNPFIIIELTGNLHFEGVMIFFLVLSLYLLQRGKWQFAAIILALSISVKLIPLIFLPLFLQWFLNRNSSAKSSINNTNIRAIFPHKIGLFGFKKLIIFYSIIGLFTLLLFLPFYSEVFVTNYSQSVGLWFGKFEFNASLYYLARAIGYLFRGYNEIAIIGKIIPIVVFLFVLAISLFKNNKTTLSLISSMLLALSFYYFTATTVHPWYVATLLMLSIFTNYKFPLVWSFAIILSYIAYSNSSNSENLWIITIEYLIVYTALAWDIFKNKKAMKIIS